MSEFILPPGFTHHALYMNHAETNRSMITTFAAEVDSDPFTLSNHASLFTDVVNALNDVYDPQWTFARLVTLVGNDGPPGRFDSPSTSAGTRANVESPPPNCAYLIQKSTGLSGRKFRGRMYWPASSESAINQNGSIISSEATILGTAADGLFDALTPPGGNNLLRPVLLHSDDTLPTAVLDFIPSGTIATQRRRLVRP